MVPTAPIACLIGVKGGFLEGFCGKDPILWRILLLWDLSAHRFRQFGLIVIERDRNCIFVAKWDGCHGRFESCLVVVKGLFFFP